MEKAPKARIGDLDKKKYLVPSDLTGGILGIFFGILGILGDFGGFFLIFWRIFGVIWDFLVEFWGF